MFNTPAVLKSGMRPLLIFPGDPAMLSPGRTPRHRFFKRSKVEPRNENVGARAEVKTFFEGPSFEEGSDASNTINWVEWQPPTLPESKKLKWEGFAIQIYKIRETTATFGNVTTFRVSHISLLSPHIQKHLKTVLSYHGVDWDSEASTGAASIKWPLQPLYFAREEIAELSKTLEDEQARAHLAKLCDVIDEELGTTIDRVEVLEKDGQITFDLLWTLFPKGTVVVGQDKNSNGLQSACRVLHSRKRSYYDSSSSSFHFKVEFVAFNGFHYRLLSRYLSINSFEGKRLVNSLPFYPIAYANESGILQDKLLVRGRRALEFQGIEYMGYQQTTENVEQVINGNEANSVEMNQVQTRVIIDAFGSNQRLSPYDGELLPGYKVMSTGVEEHTVEPVARTVADLDISLTCRPGKAQQDLNRKVASEDDVYLTIMWPYLEGYSLSSKLWTTFHIDKIYPIQLTGKAYEHLVYPEGKKDLVCSLVQHHNKHPKESNDVIAGKGQGLLVLLSGLPGTGKTLMAEAIADKVGLPLYVVDANEMATPSLINSSFDDIMKNAALWNAIILLDEADIYLQRRSEHDLTRNEIVATLLRRLEYYQGTIFLTTNLFETIDPAVESRLHVHLRFPALTFESRVEIWSNFLIRVDLTQVPIDTVSADEIRELALWKLNGREIKNVLKMTTSICKHKGIEITSKGIEDVIQATCPRAVKQEIMDGGGVDNVLDHGNGLETLLDM